ncbi:hypothetical protein ACF1HJ_09825 [Streptomyces sp. NPDC013978]|uniref:hypothetical protein n=1 Tax=Streptomyces sp. NPDC013978 TaxID=3364869 RepID=UPI0036FB299A
MAFSLDGPLLASGGAGATGRLWCADGNDWWLWPATDTTRSSSAPLGPPAKQ